MPWTFGVHPVETLIRDSPEQVQEVWFVQSRRPGEARSRLRDLVEASSIRFRMVTDQQLRAAVGDVTHQGVGARVSDYEYAEESAILELEGPRLIVVLDEVQDPHNLGAVLRSACGLGASAVVIPKHRSASVTPVVRKVSAGAVEHIAVARVTNLARFLEQARAAGYWVYGAATTAGVTVDKADFAARSVIVMGSEGRGLRRNVAEHCDVQVTLPIQGVESLNVSVAAALLIWEWSKLHRNE